MLSPKIQVGTASMKNASSSSSSSVYLNMICGIAILAALFAVCTNIISPVYDGAENSHLFRSNLSPPLPITASKNTPLVVVAAAAAAVTTSTGNGAPHQTYPMDLSHSVTLLKPVLVEVGVLLLCQAVGVPLLSKFGGVARKVPLARWTASRIRMPVAATRNLRMLQKASLRSWKSMVALYSKTGASKIVNRAKKLIKIFMHHDDEEEHEKHCPTH